MRAACLCSSSPFHLQAPTCPPCLPALTAWFFREGAISIRLFTARRPALLFSRLTPVAMHSKRRSSNKRMPPISPSWNMPRHADDECRPWRHVDSRHPCGLHIRRTRHSPTEQALRKAVPRSRNRREHPARTALPVAEGATRKHTRAFARRAASLSKLWPRRALKAAARPNDTGSKAAEPSSSTRCTIKPSIVWQAS